MSDPTETIRKLLAGRPEAADELLSTCRTLAYATEAFGGVMASQLFVRQPAPLSREPHVVAAGQGMAIFDTDGEGREQAVFADLYDGGIGRLWRLGGGAADVEAEAGLAVSADMMLSQLRTSVGLSASDHPNLDPAAVPALAALASEIAHTTADGSLVVDGRAFVLRAFSDGERGAALLALDQALGLGERRRTLAAVAFRFTAAGLTHRLVIFDRVARPATRLSLVPSLPDPDEGTL